MKSIRNIDSIGKLLPSDGRSGYTRHRVVFEHFSGFTLAVRVKSPKYLLKVSHVAGGPPSLCYECMDDELTLSEIRRLEAERKLRSIPPDILESTWVSEAQVEAVIDAVLAVTLGGAAAVARCRHVGEWCARIAAVLPYGPDPDFARRVGVLRDVDPSALERIRELQQVAAYVRAYQAFAIAGAPQPRTMSLIVAVADQFHDRITPDERGGAASANGALQAMLRDAGDESRPIVEALAAAVHPGRKSLAGAAPLSRHRRGA
jgi:hypothetical protein